jgi:hypothetical protein
MSVAAVVAVVVAVGEARTPLTEALVGAAKEAVGAAATVQVAEVSSPSDRAVLRVEAALDALAAVGLVWDDDHVRAHTRLHVARTDRWTDREIVFERADRPAERGRALGFAIASMLPEAGADIEITLPDTRAPPPEATTGRHALALAVVGAAGVDGPATGLGGAVGGELYLRDDLSLRIGLAARWGPAPAGLDGNDLVASFAAGAAWWPVAPAPSGRFGLAVRADALAILHQLFVSSQDGTSTKGALVPGADLLVEATLRVGGGWEVAAAVGMEAAFARFTVLDEAGREAVPPFRGVGQLGVRVRF